MPRPANREEVLARLRKTVADGSIIVGAGAGKVAHIIASSMIYSIRALLTTPLCRNWLVC